MKSKYKKNAEKLLRMIDIVYRWLPLGTLVDNKVLVVHGGISDITDLNWIKNIDRQKVGVFWYRGGKLRAWDFYSPKPAIAHLLVLVKIPGAS